MGNLKKSFEKEIAPALLKDLGLKNPMATPKLNKIVLNIGLKEGISDPKVISTVSEQVATITGQKPKVAKAKKAIAAFKLRKGDPIGLMVTLRGKRMYDFIEKLIYIVLPRVRDFHGVPIDAFDGHGNYSLGIKEQIVFPEIDYAKIDKTRSLEITICTTSKNDEGGRKLLTALGLPFQK
jgi:large subunit ribosomal protein L5